MKRFALFLVLLLTTLCTNAASVYNVCTGITTTTTSTGVGNDTPATYFATVTGTGSVSATICIQGSMDGTNYDPACILTLTPSATSPAMASAVSVASRYAYYRCNVTAISGTGATVKVTVGVQP